MDLPRHEVDKIMVVVSVQHVLSVLEKEGRRNIYQTKFVFFIFFRKTKDI